MKATKVAVKATTLVFDGVTVVDVVQGTLLPAQRVVLSGTRIVAVGPGRKVKMPADARVVDAREQYLIPGLWDMHTHSEYATDTFYPLFIANGVTGIRDAGSKVPLDTLIRWRREILAGTRVGPPRQILSGAAIDGDRFCARTDLTDHTCVVEDDTADAHQLVEALKRAGADMVKTYDVDRQTYFNLAAAARRAGVPFGGHVKNLSAREASDSGATLIDHIRFDGSGSAEIISSCWLTYASASAERCRDLAMRFQRNHTWVVPTLYIYAAMEDPYGERTMPVFDRLSKRVKERRADTALVASKRTQGSKASTADSMMLTGGAPMAWSDSSADSLGLLYLAQRVGLPIVAGTDVNSLGIGPALAGDALHAELEMYVAEGMTPLSALQTATLNPAKALHATDSLGTVAEGKLADLVLLDANPLADITNTTKVRAVVANGRYFDRAALDQLLAELRTRGIP